LLLINAPQHVAGASPLVGLQIYRVYCTHLLPASPGSACRDGLSGLSQTCCFIILPLQQLKWPALTFHTIAKYLHRACPLLSGCTRTYADSHDTGIQSDCTPRAPQRIQNYAYITLDYISFKYLAAAEPPANMHFVTGQPNQAAPKLSHFGCPAWNCP